MSGSQQPRPSHTDEDLDSQNKIQGAEGGQGAIQADDTTFASGVSSSSYLPVITPSSVCNVIPSVSMQEIGATGASSQSPPSGRFSSSSRVSMPWDQSVHGFHRQSGLQPVNSEALPIASPCICVQIDVKVNELVRFLLHKYRKSELTTKKEMLYKVIRNAHQYYPLIFDTAAQYLLLTFGTEVKEVDPSTNCYCLCPALGLTYDGMVSDTQGLPKTGLLIAVLTIIYKKGHRANQEEVRSVLNAAGVFGDSYRFIYPNAWKLITEDFLQEGYLLYHQVPHCVPAEFEFLWGPRAHFEIDIVSFNSLFTLINKAEQRLYRCHYLRLLALI